MNTTITAVILGILFGVGNIFWWYPAGWLVKFAIEKGWMSEPEDPGDY